MTALTLEKDCKDTQMPDYYFTCTATEMTSLIMMAGSVLPPFQKLVWTAEPFWHNSLASLINREV